MRRLRCGLVAAVAVGAFVATTAGSARAIVGGSPDNNEHPFVGQLLFYVPEAADSRFDDPGGWFNCTGTLIDADTVLTAGHCTYAVGLDGEAPTDPLQGGTDVWFNVSAAPDYSVLPASSTFVPDGNQERYNTWSSILDDSAAWSEAAATYTHPAYVDTQFLLHDLGVVELSEPIVLPEYGTLPDEGYLDQYYAKKNKQQGLFESVGYGLEDSGPKFALGGDTRRKADRKLVSYKGAFGYKNIAVKFSHQGAGTDGGTCFGDSGGPTFDISTPELAERQLVVAVTSFGKNYNCNASGSYRIDQADDLAFVADPEGAYSP